MHSRAKIRNKKWSAVMTLFVLTVYIFTSMPIYYAISQPSSAVCSIPEHIHTEQCYELSDGNSEKVLNCDHIYADETVYHTHDSFCYNDDVKICSLEEAVHIHDDSCFNDTELICGAVFHQHNEDCLTVAADNESESVLICGEEEHQHSDACYDIRDSGSDEDSDPEEDINSDENSSSNDDSAPSENSDPDENGSSDENTEDTENNDAETITLEFMYLPDDALILTQTPENTVAVADISNGALELTSDTNINSITAYYQVSGNWVKITEANCNDLPADAKYQFEFSYYGITIAALTGAGGRMYYSSLPDWFIPNSNGVLLDGEDVAADITVSDDGTIIITFYEDWLEKHKDDTILKGSFRVSGTADWHKLQENAPGIPLPGMTVVLDFEKGLAEKYGTLDIEKSDPTLEPVNGKYYLKYELTVTNTDSVDMPYVNVKDIFGNMDYINGYVGIPDGLAAGDYAPKENGGNTLDLSVSTDGSMTWNIGELKPYEKRTLTYYAEISEEYVSEVTSNPITNTASVYSGEVRKDMDTRNFIPKNEIQVSKDAEEDAFVDNKGNGTIEYTVTIYAPDDNSFTLENLTLKDSFPDELRPYFSGDSGNGGKITVTIDYGEEEPYTKTVDYTNASFELSGLELEPGSTVTITYTVSFKNIFFVNNGHAELTNTATVSKGARDLKSTLNTKTLDKQTWSRKIVGSPIEGNMTINMDANDGVYEYADNGIKKENPTPDRFEVPDGSLKYQVVLNENGQWDLSSTSMTDEFSNDYLKYVGYVQVQIFKRPANAQEGLSDSSLISELERTDAVETVWLKIGDMGRFAFKPEELGIKSDTYTYLLTYYAQPQNVENVGSVSVSNKFRIEGTVGDGSGGQYELPGIEVSVGTVVQGGVKYNASKTSWYYEPNPSENGTVDIWTEGSSYENGALYWIIRLEGTIPNGFIVRDQATSGNMVFCYDSIPVVYRGPKSLDLASYDSFGALLHDDDNGLESLVGRKYNGLWYKEELPSDAVYDWQLEVAGTGGPLRLTFLKEMQLEEDEAVYIVVRTNPSTSMPTKKNDKRTFTNDLYVNVGGNSALVDKASYTYEVRYSMLKESKGAYIYDKKDGSFTNCSNRYGGDWNVNTKVDKDKLDTTGIYATWLLNINYDGTMAGTYDVSDYLPEGMELVYVDVNNFGVAIKNDLNHCPSTIYIQELNEDPEWHEMTKTSKDDRGRDIETITYYNPTTREIRWRIINFTRNPGQLREINFRIICKVIDPELILNQKKTYVNEAVILDPLTNEPVDVTDADVTITFKIDKNVDLKTLEILEGSYTENGVEMKPNRLPFKIEINPYGDDICDGETLPALIDELSSTIELIENSIEVIKSDESKYTDFTYDVEYKDGHQVLIIYGLPDSTPLTVKYSARLIAKPEASVTVSNTAYWAGSSPPDSPQVGGLDATYNPSGEVFKTDAITVTINKVDFDSHSKKLDGAEFELYEMDSDGTKKDPYLRSGITDSMGQVVFDNNNITENSLKFNTVYCITERTAPNGYKLNDGGDDANSYYFIIIDAINPLTDDEIAELKLKYTDLDIWYDSPDYSVVIENKKGTISVNKGFKYEENGEIFTPTSGSYRFGLFDDVGKAPLEILTIVYKENGEPDYYLDGVPKESPHFTKFDPETAYRIYELDDSNSPISDGETVKLNDVYYRVKYSDDRVTINGSATITNYAVKCFDLTISKTVAGNMGNRNDSFSFTLTLTDMNGDPLTGTYKTESGKDITITDGTYTFTLRHGESITIKGIPTGTTYSIIEDDNEYKTTITTTDSADTVDGKRIDGTLDDTKTVAYTNTIISAIPTGVAEKHGWVIPIFAAAFAGVFVFIFKRRMAAKSVKGGRSL